jgi:uncharacterized protein (TIGR03546 family)
MLLLKIIRKIGQWLRGGAGTREIFIAAFLGFAVGMLPGINLTLGIGILLLLILNANLGVALPMLAAGKLISLGLAPVTMQTGYYIIHNMGLEGTFKALATAPVTALMDLDVYCVAGGLPFAIVGGLLFGWLLAFLVNKLRAVIKGTKEGSATVQKIGGNVFVRVALWLIFGGSSGQTEKKEETPEPAEPKKAPLFRTSGIVLVLIVVVIFVGVEFILLNYYFQTGVKKGLEYAVGAQVDIKKAVFTITGGKLEIEDLQITDPSKPETNLVSIEKMVAALSVRDLLARQIVISDITANGMATGTKREKPGEVFKKPPKVEEPEEPSDSLMKYFDDAKKAVGYLKKGKEYYDWYNDTIGGDAAEEAIPEEAKKPELSYLEELGKNKGYFTVAARDSLVRRPSLVVKKFEVDKAVLLPEWGQMKILGTELSSHPQYNPNPMTVSLTPDAGGPPMVALEMHYGDGKPHQVEVNKTGVAMEGMIKLSDKSPVNVEGGVADISAKGTFTKKKMNLPFTVHITRLKSTVKEGRSVLGMDTKTAQQVFSRLTELSVTGSLEGSLPFPRLKLDEKKMAADLGNTLKDAAKAEAQKKIDEEKKKAEEKLKQEANKIIEEKVPDKVKDELKDKIKIDNLPNLFNKK